jgi:hypothetical protein
MESSLLYVVTACGRICMHRKKINLSTVLASQRVALKEVEDSIRLVIFMKYDLGYIDLEQKTLQTIDAPFGTSILPIYVSRMDPIKYGAADRT